MFWQLWHICIFWTTVQKLSCFTGSFASMPIGRREKYKDLIFTAHIGQQNPGITKIIPSVDKSTHGQDRGSRNFRSAVVWLM